MRILDKKDRLFGLINIIDLIVVILLLSFIPFVYQYYNMCSKNKVIKKQLISIRLKFPNMNPEIATRFSPNDVERDSFGNIIGRITEIESITPSKELTIDYNKITISQNNKNVILKVDILCSKKAEELYYYKDSLIKIGRNISFASKWYSFEGLIIGIEIPKERNTDERF